jgi:hypothetical protein
MSGRYIGVDALYTAIEALVAEATAPLKTFPGFDSRPLKTDPCKHLDGTADVNREYRFAEAYRAPAVRVHQLEAVKAHWVDLGYEVEDPVAPR